jgi:hypothetical protein
MTASPIVHWTAGTLLYGEDVVAGLRARVADPSVAQALNEVDGIGTKALRAIQQKLPAVLADFVNVDLATVVLAGWRKHRDLVQAARTTLDPASGTEEVPVPLATHDIVLTQRPSLDVLFNGQKVQTLRFELTVTTTVIGAEAVVSRGRLAKVRSGALEIEAAFKGQGIDLGKVKRTVDARLLLPLGRGIPLAVPQQRGSNDQTDPQADWA